MAIRTKILAGAVLAFSAAPVLAAPGDGTQIIKDMMMENCSPESKDTLSGLVREAIESKVLRAEASILPPSPVGDLACIQDLMNAPLDKFSNIGGLMDSLKGSLGGSLGSIPGLPGGGSIGDQVCAFAAEKWSELTEPLDMALGDLQKSSKSVSNVWDNFDIDLVRSGDGATGAAPIAGSGSGSTWDGIDWTDNGDSAPEGTGTEMSAEDLLEVLLKNIEDKKAKEDAAYDGGDR